MATDKSLAARFWRLTAINTASNITVPMVGLVDTAMLGHLPDVRFLAGVALATVLFDYLYWGVGFLRMATTGTTAQAVGRRDRRAIGLSLQRGLVLAAGAAALFVVFHRPLGALGFAALAGTAEVEAAGLSYFNARILGAPAALANMVLLGWFLGREQSGRALVVTAVANVSNVAFNFLFIYHLGWAARGAGLASMAGQYVALAVALWLARRMLAELEWIPSQVLERNSLLGLMKLNRDLFVRTVGLITAFACFTNFSALLGTTVLAANSILLRLVELAAFAIDGGAFATESLAGIAWGKRDGQMLRSLLRLALIAGLVMAAIALLPVVAAPGAVLGLLTSHAEVTTLARRWSVFLVPTLFLGAIAYVLDGFFLGLTSGRVLRNSMLFSLVCFLPPAWAAVVLERPELLWWALVALMAARVLTLALCARTTLPLVEVARKEP